MPLLTDHGSFHEQGGYRAVLESAFLEQVSRVDPNLGGLAVVYDKNPVEASGYCSAMSDLMQEDVFLVEFYDDDPNPPINWIDGIMHVRDANDGTFNAHFKIHSSLVNSIREVIKHVSRDGLFTARAAHISFHIHIYVCQNC